LVLAVEFRAHQGTRDGSAETHGRSRAYGSRHDAVGPRARIVQPVQRLSALYRVNGHGPRSSGRVGRVWLVVLRAPVRSARPVIVFRVIAATLW
jgi:hypothetical protein